MLANNDKQGVLETVGLVVMALASRERGPGLNPGLSQ